MLVFACPEPACVILYKSREKGMFSGKIPTSTRRCGAMFYWSLQRASFPLSCFFVIADYFAVFVQSARENLGQPIHFTRQLCLHLWTHRMHLPWYAFCPLGLRKNAHSSIRFIYHRLSKLVKLALFFGLLRLCNARL